MARLGRSRWAVCIDYCAVHMRTVRSCTVQQECSTGAGCEVEISILFESVNTLANVYVFYETSVWGPFLA